MNCVLYLLFIFSCLGYNVAGLSLPRDKGISSYQIRDRVVRRLEDTRTQEELQTDNSDQINGIGASTAPLPPLIEPVWRCGQGIEMDPGDTDATVAALKDQTPECTTLGPGKSTAVVVGDVIAFATNEPSWERTITVCAADIDLYMSEITKSCGSYVPGTRGKVTPKPSLTIGYMRKDYNWYRRRWSSPYES